MGVPCRSTTCPPFVYQDRAYQLIETPSVLRLHIPTADKKQDGPVTLFIFLVILLDTERLEARLPPEKLANLNGRELVAWLVKKTHTKPELLSLIGLLSFVAKVVPPDTTPS